jgi:hypothetical protein
MVGGRSLLAASAGGDPGVNSQESILETPTYSLTLLLLTFQVVSIIFTVIVKTIRYALKKRRRFGLLKAVDHSVHELTLLGFVSIILLSLERVITDICIDASFFRPDWTVLQSVYGKNECPCCLENTKYVQKCVLEYASCGDSSPGGDAFCNCDGQDPTCVPQKLTGEEAEPYAAQVCNGPVALDGLGQCGEGKVRAVSYLALEQTHLLIFLLSIIHVVCGFVLYGLAWFRVKWEWGKWETASDEHHEKVREAISMYYNDLDTTLQRRSMNHAELTAREQSTASCPELEGADEAGGGGALDDESLDNEQVDDCKENRKRRITVAFDGAPIGGPPKLERRSATMPTILGREDEETGPSIFRMTALKRSKSFHNLVSLEKSLRRQIVSKTKKCSIATWRFTKDVMHTLFQGIGPLIVTRSQYNKLRASFIYTHKLGGNFNFLQHVLQSMEDDLAHLVGITPLFWLITMIFWLISGLIGYAVMPFMIVTAVLMILLNAKLASIVKEIVAKLGSGHALILQEHIFWFNNPELMLQPMKFCLFFTSFIFNSFMFFAWQFGPGACTFSDAFYGPTWRLPWWTIIIFNVIIFLHLAMVTFPAYSLAVQMGSNLKGHMLPSRFVKKLLKAVDEAKKEVEEERRKREQEQAAGGRPAVFNRLFRRSAGAIGMDAASGFVGLTRPTIERMESDQL